MNFHCTKDEVEDAQLPYQALPSPACQPLYTDSLCILVNRISQSLIHNTTPCHRACVLMLSLPGNPCPVLTESLHPFKVKSSLTHIIIYFLIINLSTMHTSFVAVRIVTLHLCI